MYLTPYRHLWQLSNAALCTGVTTLLARIAEHGADAGSPLNAKVRSSFRRKFTSPLVDGSTTSRSLSVPRGSGLPRSVGGGVASSGELEIASRSWRRSELKPENIFSEKVSMLVCSELNCALTG